MWVPIRYLELWDVPRIFLAEWRGRTLLFDCQFNEEVEDYPDFYLVFLVPAFTEERLRRPWHDLYEEAEQSLGRMAIADVLFDPTRQKAVDSSILETVLGRAAVPTLP